MSVITQYHGSTTMKELVKWVNFPRSSYYYKPSNNRKGIAPSTTTTKRDGTEISNNEVVEEIKKIVSGEFVCYGYQNVTSVLKVENPVTLSTSFRMNLINDSGND